MKNKASELVKEFITELTTMAKSKTLAIKRKTDAIRTRIIIFSLLSNRKFLMTSMSQKLSSLIRQDEKKILKEDDNGRDEQTNDKCIVIYNNNAMSYESLPNTTQTETFQEVENPEECNGGDAKGIKECVKNIKYPEVTHSLCQEDVDDDFEDPGGSVIDIVKNSKQDGREFRLEDEIDLAADLFIKRFHRQMRIQKQQSLKRGQDMLEKSI